MSDDSTSGTQPTALCATITEATNDAAIEAIGRAKQLGADLAEVRLDYIDDPDPGVIGQAAALPVLWTARSKDQGGRWTGDDFSRNTVLMRSMTLGGGGLVDLELSTVQLMAAVQKHSGLEQGIAGGSTDRLEVIVSDHDFEATPDDLRRRVERMFELNADIAKVAAMANHINDTFVMFDLLHEYGRRVIALSMGQAGVMTRILSRKLGGRLSFASMDDASKAAPGQVPVTDMKNLYRWEHINPDTKVFGVIGSPVGHSMSPAIHNTAFDACDYDGVYVPFLLEGGYDEFARFMQQWLERDWLDFGGCSVTIPHKEHALRWLKQAGGQVEPLAEAIGAVNTIVVRQDGSVSGWNTDYAAAIDSLTTAMGITRSDLAGVPVAVLGAGGVSRAVVAALADCGAAISIYNRTASRAEELAGQFNATAKPWDQRADMDASVVINCTSIGMSPHVDDCPIPAEILDEHMTVFDTIYNPVRTRLLQCAEQAGSTTVDGVSMFVDQAAGQFERWTGQAAPKDVMRSVVLHRLGASESH